MAGYRTLTLAEAELDVQAKRIHIQRGETGITFTGVQPWKGLHEVLREVNEELARANAGVVVWKITPKEEGQTHPGEHLYPEGVPALRNGQALAHVTGYANDRDHTLVYTGLVGYKTSLESLRVTLASGKPVTMTWDGAGNVSLIPTDRYEQSWQVMTEHTGHPVHAHTCTPGTLDCRPRQAGVGRVSHAAFVSRLVIQATIREADLRSNIPASSKIPTARLFCSR